MSHKKNIAITSLMALGFMLSTGSIFANNFSYNYAEAGFVDLDGGDGFTFGGSYEINPEMFLQGSFVTADADNSDADVTGLTMGVGYHQPIADKTDGVGFLGLGKADYSGSGSDDSDTGFILSGGVRHMFTDQLEATAALTHTSIGDSDTNFTFGARFHINEKYSVGATLSTDDADTMTVTGRMNF